MTRKEAPMSCNSIADRESAKETIAASKAHLGMLRSKSGDAAAHVARGEKAIAESRKALADADIGRPKR